MELDPALSGNTMPLRNKNGDDADLLKGHGWIVSVLTGRHIASRNDLMHRFPEMSRTPGERLNSYSCVRPAVR
jgi:hypothetical protein